MVGTPKPEDASGTSTLRFTSQAPSAEDLLKSHTVGLVDLADFRKRRADVLERSATNTPGLEDDEGSLTPKSDAPPFRKKKKQAQKILSFGDEDEAEDQTAVISSSKATKSGSKNSSEAASTAKKRRPNPNSTLPAPKAMTKAALAAEATEREALRKEFLEMQDKVRNTEIVVPFVFYDGSNLPGGTVRVKKGDRIWLILERARKVGAETGAGGANANGVLANHSSKDDNRRQWARVGVDDLILLRGDVIIPHHYEIYYFIANRTPDPFRVGELLFDYSGTEKEPGEEVQLLRVPGKEQLEGHDHDPTYTKVVDRRWYEKNKHIFPASTWKEYKIGHDPKHVGGGKKDAEGNAFFFS